MVRELSKHPQVLADILSLSAASDEARLAAAREEPFEEAGTIPCIEALRGEAACVVPEEDYEASLVLSRKDVGGRSLCAWFASSMLALPIQGCFSRSWWEAMTSTYEMGRAFVREYLTR